MPGVFWNQMIPSKGKRRHFHKNAAQGFEDEREAFRLKHRTTHDDRELWAKCLAIGVPESVPDLHRTEWPDLRNYVKDFKAALLIELDAERRAVFGAQEGHRCLVDLMVRHVSEYSVSEECQLRDETKSEVVEGAGSVPDSDCELLLADEASQEDRSKKLLKKTTTKAAAKQRHFLEIQAQSFGELDY
ncbi:unnamed protein product, partial [Amoebophrya sp. A25]|eukprot:GSA25T00011732001.1